MMSEPVSYPKPLSESGAADRYSAGEILEGKYRLIRRIGQGGFSQVWLAHNSVLDVDVALKLIYLDEPKRRSFIERALSEARAAAQIGHPAIVHVFDFGMTRRDDPFVAMELLQGETLADRLASGGRMSSVEAVQLLLPIADALAAAHAVGIVHRDVKPENVFLARNARWRVQPKLLDFGIARRIDADHRITAAGSIVGTPDYMSPEQARGQATDPRTDVWSFSVVLYELISGRVPFCDDNYNALLMAIIEREPEPLTELLAGDQQLWQLIAKGLAKDPSQRWQTIRALGEALAQWLYDRGIHEDLCSSSIRGMWLDQASDQPKIEITLPLSPRESEPVTREATVSTSRSAIFALGIASALALLIGGATLAGQDRADPEKVKAPAAQPAESAAPGPPPPEIAPTTEAAKITAQPEPPPLTQDKPPTPRRAVARSTPVPRTSASAPSPKPDPAHDTPLERAKRIDFGF